MSKKLKALVATGLVAMLGLVGCSSGQPEPQPSQTIATTAAAVATEESNGGTKEAGGLSNQEACLLFATKGMEAVEALGDGVPSDYQKVLDAQVAFTDALKEAGEAAADPEFTAQALKAYELSRKVNELDKKLHIDGDASVGKQAIQASKDFNEAYADLLALCSK